MDKPAFRHLHRETRSEKSLVASFSFLFSPFSFPFFFSGSICGDTLTGQLSHKVYQTFREMETSIRKRGECIGLYKRTYWASIPKLRVKRRCEKRKSISAGGFPVPTPVSGALPRSASLECVYTYYTFNSFFPKGPSYHSHWVFAAEKWIIFPLPFPTRHPFLSLFNNAIRIESKDNTGPRSFTSTRAICTIELQFFKGRMLRGGYTSWRKWTDGIVWFKSIERFFFFCISPVYRARGAIHCQILWHCDYWFHDNFNNFITAAL